MRETWTTRWPDPIAGRTRGERLKVPRDELHTAWAYLGCLPWQWFVTLTIDPKRTGASRDTADREAFWWCGLLGKAARRPVGWLYALERSRSGAWHAHALVIGVGTDSLDPPSGMWRARNGIIDPKRVTNGDGEQVVLYTTKQAYRTGDLVLSDTLVRYRGQTVERARVSLYG